LAHCFSTSNLRRLPDPAEEFSSDCVLRDLTQQMCQTVIS
jgi:hypothetical protein